MACRHGHMLHGASASGSWKTEDRVGEVHATRHKLYADTWPQLVALDTHTRKPFAQERHTNRMYMEKKRTAVSERKTGKQQPKHLNALNASNQAHKENQWKPRDAFELVQLIDCLLGVSGRDAFQKRILY